MRKQIKPAAALMLGLLAAALCAFSALAAGTPDYERDYMTRIFNSDNGLEGAAVKCICASDDGFIWVGSYTGLYCYDGTEFQKVLIDGRAIVVNDIVQDSGGDLWIGTNGDGIYRYDGSDFIQYDAVQLPDGAEVINKLYLELDGMLFAATKNGLFSIDPADVEQRVTYYDALAGKNLRDVCALNTGEKVLIEKSSEVYLLDGKALRPLNFLEQTGGLAPRSCTCGRDGMLYVGTTGSALVKLSGAGNVLRVIDGVGLSSINSITEFESGRFWVCSDTGIGVLERDGLRRVRTLVEDSLEEMCIDYQGNFWFASSRQGIMQLYQNGFSNLGAYWGLHKAVNAIQKYGEKVYIGCDDGLHCYVGRQEIADALTQRCGSARIRQLYVDRENALWVLTYQDGIKLLRPDGEIVTYNTENTGLTTDQIRCVRQTEDGSVLVGTEQGVFVEQDGKFRRLVEDDGLNSKRVLDVTAYDGTVYAATDGYGVYEIRGHKITQVYTKKQGLSSGVVMKLVPSERLQGVWFVAGEELYFVKNSKYGGVPQPQRAANIGIANSLDMLLLDDGDAVILAGNGLFKIKEADLLEEAPTAYIHLTRRDGLPIDFTANAENTVDDGVLYLCGTMGAASADLTARPPQRAVRLYLKGVTADGQPLEI